MITIYMPLLSEGVEVWRPVNATPLSSNTYRVEGEVPGDEEWAFAPGSVVRCVNRVFSESEGLAIIGLAV